MDFDAKMFDKIKNMDNSEFNKKIEETAQSMGLDARMLKLLIGNPENLKNKLQKLNADEVRRLSSKLSPEMLSKIKENLK